MKKQILTSILLTITLGFTSTFAQNIPVDRVQLLSNDLQITKENFVGCFNKVYPIQSKPEYIFLINNSDKENKEKLLLCLKNYNPTLSLGRINLAISLRNNEDNKSNK